MAATVLVGVLLISLAVYLFTIFGNFSADMTKELTQKDIDELQEKKDNNTDVLLANGNLVEMTKFIGNIVYEESTGTLYFQTPLETEESIVASNVTVPTVTTSNDGLMTSEDLEKLNEIDIEEIW